MRLQSGISWIKKAPLEKPVTRILVDWWKSAAVRSALRSPSGRMSYKINIE